MGAKACVHVLLNECDTGACVDSAVQLCALQICSAASGVIVGRAMDFFEALRVGQGIMVNGASHHGGDDEVR